MQKVSKRVGIVLALSLLGGLLVGFIGGWAIGTNQEAGVVEEMEEEKEASGIEEALLGGIPPKEALLYYSGSVVDSVEGLWQIETTGTPSGNVVFSTFGEVVGPNNLYPGSVPEGYKVKVIDVGPGGLNWCYEFEERVIITDARRLANGNYLFLAGFAVYEITPEGEKVVFIRVPGATHHADKLPNGNYLVVSSMENRVYEITKEEEIVWSWDADEALKYLWIREEYQHFLNATYIPWPVQSPDWGESRDWVHINYAQRLENGNTIISLRNMDLVVEVTPDGSILRTFGALFLKCQHTPVYDPDRDSLLIFDNGHDRVVEVDWSTQRIIWEYQGVHSVINGSCQRLDNGNILICDSCQSRIIEVTLEGETVWELVVPGMQIYRAFGY